MYAACNGGGEKWEGSVQKKMTIVTREITKLAADKAYWTKLMRSSVTRAQEIIDNGGNVVL